MSNAKAQRAMRDMQTTLAQYRERFNPTQPDKVIKKLTPEQEALLPKFAEWGVAIGTDTGPADREAVKAALPEVYRGVFNLPPPSRVEFHPNPIAAIQAMQEATGLDASTLFQAAQYGNHDAGRLMYYQYARDVLGLRRETEPVAGLIKLRDVCGWFWCFEDVFVACDRPTAIHNDANGRDHNPAGPSIEYEGLSIYSLRGVLVPSDIITNPETLTPERIERERNAEVRRVMLEQYGFERYLMAGGAKLLDSDPRFGDLYQKQVEDDEPLTMLMVTNRSPEPDGTFKRYALQVHPELRPRLGKEPDGTPIYGEPQAMTARNAVASTFRMYGKDYLPEVET